MHAGRQSIAVSNSFIVLEIARKHQPFEPAELRAQLRPAIDVKLTLRERAGWITSAEPRDIFPRSVSNQDEREVVEARVMPNDQNTRMLVWRRGYGGEQVLRSGEIQGIVRGCRDLDAKLG